MRLSAPVRLCPQTSHDVQAYHTWTAGGNARRAELFSSLEEPYGHDVY